MSSRSRQATQRALPQLVGLPPWNPAERPACALVTRAEAFFAPGWLYELKYDGFRALLSSGAARRTLTYRSGRDASELFPEVLEAARSLAAHEALVDGELVVPGRDGHPDFEAMRARGLASRSRAGAPAATFCAFDILALSGRDVRGLPLVKRKHLLRDVVPVRHPNLLYVDHVDETKGPALLAGAIALRLEGVVAKRAESRYRNGSAAGWLKFKVEDSSDFIVLGLCDPSPATFDQPGAILGRATTRGVRIVGRVALPPSARRVVEELEPSLRTVAPRAARGSPARVWFRPALVCEVRHLPTRGVALRHPVFVRFRPEKAWAECRD